MINLALRSEYSFKKVFGKVEDVLKFNNEQEYIGIADHNNTFSHIYLQNYCKENNLKPIFGVRLEVVKTEFIRTRGIFGPKYIFIAKNNSGLKELNDLVTEAWRKFYYKPMISWEDLENISDDIFVIAETVESFDLRLDYLAITTTTPKMLLHSNFPKKVFIQNNFYPTPYDRGTYELFCGARKRNDDWYYQYESHTYPQHILSTSEMFRILPLDECIRSTYDIAKQCTAYIPKAPMVKYIGNENFEVECYIGAEKLGINIEDGPYAERLQYEIEIIKKKEYVDYFLVVSDLIKFAKKHMFVGPGRGSSAGSLVCYLLGITTVDPLKHGLLFERFIDISREDLPDIDIDFQDNGREKVIKYLFKKYGSDNVCHISNINTMKPKSAMDEFGKGLLIPKYEIDQLKDSIVDRSGGDARAKLAIEDTLETTNVGKDFLQKYPEMILVKNVQGHAAHAGKHAAGIIVCPDDITKYGGINKRENSVMLNKKGADFVNLLKIDCLGLRTLSILDDAAKLAGLKTNFLYDIELNDQKTFNIFKEMRLHGIFQFEGNSMNMLCEKMGIENFADIVNITALSRPGPLHSGGADKFIKRRTGKEPVIYLCDHEKYIEATKDTFGIIVYQEQLMNLCRECGNMSVTDVAAIRRAASKTMGKEFFDKYRDMFLKGTRENEIPNEQAIDMWENMMTFGSWGMNKSHSVSYGMISYWCAYMKAHHPLEYTVANLNHSKSPESALRILRDAYENEGIEHIPVDIDKSEINWSINDGKLLGGLVNIKNIGEKKAIEILKARNKERDFTTGMAKLLWDPVTEFDYLYPCREFWGRLYDNPKKYGLERKPDLIKNIARGIDGTYIIIGKLIKKDLRDLNEYNELVKRGGKYLERDNMFLKMVLEDDTGIIYCSINRFNFDKLNGMYYAESGIEDETWYIVKGTIKGDWQILNIEMIYDLTKDPNGVFVNEKH